MKTLEREFLNAKGQAVLIDFILGLAVFGILLAFIASGFDAKFDETEKTALFRSMKVKAGFASDGLVNSKGLPENWENFPDATSVQYFGLALNERELSEKKLSAFANMASGDYDEVKKKLGLEEFEYFLEFSGVDSFESGNTPDTNANQAVVERVVLYKGKTATLKLNVYSIEK